VFTEVEAEVEEWVVGGGGWWGFGWGCVFRTGQEGKGQVAGGRRQEAGGMGKRQVSVKTVGVCAGLVLFLVPHT